MNSILLVDEIVQDPNRSSRGKPTHRLRSPAGRQPLLDLAFQCLDALSPATVTTPRTPASIFLHWTRSNGVYGTQPILEAIESTAAHNPGVGFASPAATEQPILIFS